MVTFGRSKGDEYFVQKEIVSEIRYIKPEWWKLTTNFNYLNPVNGGVIPWLDKDYHISRLLEPWFHFDKVNLIF